jgi:alpha-methylacyl-CoA racemase
MAGPLSGCRVVEFAGQGPGPFAAMLLADMGADVVRVERSGTRGRTADKYVMHRGRRSIAVNLKDPEGLEIVLRLIDDADALIEPFRPGVMERLRLGPDECLDRNPRIIYGRMTGWGQEGPLATTAGHDIDYIAISGALGCIARPGERPVPPVNFLGDFAGGGLFLALGIVAAMWETKTSGQGQVIDAAMIDGSAVITTMLYGMMAQGRWRDEAGVNFADGGSHYYDTYTCADGRHIAVGAIEGPFYDELLKGLGLADAELPDQGDEAAWPLLKERFAAVFATRSLAEWTEIFEGSDACVAPILHLSEAHAHPHNAARDVFVERGGIVQPAPAPRFGRTPATLDRLPPKPGQHSTALLAELGYTPDDIARLTDTGAITPAFTG